MTEPEDLPFVQASGGVTNGTGNMYVNENVAPLPDPAAAGKMTT
jgi:hypothetical protein